MPNLKRYIVTLDIVIDITDDAVAIDDPDLWGIMLSADEYINSVVATEIPIEREAT